EVLASGNAIRNIQIVDRYIANFALFYSIVRPYCTSHHKTGRHPSGGTMNNEIRRSTDRGYADHGWLKSFHSFSFADYFDPEHVEFGPLRVINEDRVSAGEGFGTHGHRDMEIISCVLSGELAHKDSMGNGSTIRPGDVQRMSAGRGVLHSEFNPSASAPVHFLQIWIQPDKHQIEPSYEEKRFNTEEK